MIYEFCVSLRTLRMYLYQTSDSILDMGFFTFFVVLLPPFWTKISKFGGKGIRKEGCCLKCTRIER